MTRTSITAWLATTIIIILALPLVADNSGGGTNAFGPSRAGFQENRGQVRDADGNVRNDILFVADGPGVRLFLHDRGISYVFTSFDMKRDAGEHSLGSLIESSVQHPSSAVAYRLDMTLLGGSARARIRAADPLPGQLNFYLAHCPRGITGVREYRRLVYENVYEQIDLELLAVPGGVKYNFIVRQGGRVDDIRMRYTGADVTRLTADGALDVITPHGRIHEARPYSYIEDGHRPVASRFVRSGDIVSFEVDAYDHSRTLVIDPWATYYGGSGSDAGYGMLVEGNGDIVMSGRTTSIDFPVSTGGQVTNAGSRDAFIVKMSASGTRLWATYFGGSGDEEQPVVSANTAGKFTLAGYTNSPDMPVTGGAFQAGYAGGGDMFVAQFDTYGQRLWSTYYGGSKYENYPCVSTDSNGDILLSGSTGSRNFPISPGAFQTSPSSMFVVKLNENGTQSWATFFGYGHGFGIACDNANDVLVTGMAGAGFPVTAGASQTVNGGANDAFIVKLTGSGSRVWATYFGGNNNEWPRAIETTENGNFVIGGYTQSTNLPLYGSPFQSIYSGGTFDAFFAGFTSTGVPLWSTYYGGSLSDVVYDLSVDAADNCIFVGYSSSPNFPVSANAFQTVHAGREDAIVVSFTSGGSRNWSTYFGGSDVDISSSVGVDSYNTAFFTGSSASVNLPILNAFQSTLAGESDAFIAQFNSFGLLPGYNVSPVAAATATPFQGITPLAVSFSSAGSFDPDGSIVAYAWNFGDGSSSIDANPSHTYIAAGGYVATLTVTDNYGATDHASVQITVTAAGGYMYVAEQSVTRVSAGGSKFRGVDMVRILDAANQPVGGATVTATYTGPNSGTVSAVTDASGYTTLPTAVKSNPSGLWCFNVTNLQKNGYAFNQSIGILTACEPLPKSVSELPGEPTILAAPNPARTHTLIHFTVPQAGKVRLSIFNTLGEEVCLLAEGEMPAGTHAARWNLRGNAGERLSPGIYFCRIAVGDPFGRTKSSMLHLILLK